jgi:AcrR family transcriptional regulator
MTDNDTPNRHLPNDAKEALLQAATTGFSRYGFDGITTRALAETAGVNQQAIPYHFGGKTGLYLAVAERIAKGIREMLDDIRKRIENRLKTAEATGSPIPRKEAESLVLEFLETLATILTSRKTESWVGFLIREQLEPTEAFHRIDEQTIKPLLSPLNALIAVLLQDDPASQHVRLRTLSLVGSVLTFRIARASVATQLGWQLFGPGENGAIRNLLAETIAGIRAADG